MDFEANRFLRKMVRTLVGTLVEIGRGKMHPSEACDILSSRDRKRAGPCAPPHGLYLVGVDTEGPMLAKEVWNEVLHRHREH